MGKKRIYLGKKNDSWSRYDDDFEEGIKKIYDGHFPICLPVHEIFNDFMDRYDVTGSRMKSDIEAHIYTILKDREPFYYSNFTYSSCLAAREWSPFPKDGYYEDGSFVLFRAKCIKEKLIWEDADNYLECRVGLHQILDGKNLFIFPRSPYVDFAKVFHKIFTFFPADKHSLGKVNDKRKELINIDEDKWVEVKYEQPGTSGYNPGKEKRQELKKTAIIYSSHYLLDCILAVLLANLDNKECCLKTIKSVDEPNDHDRLFDALSTLKSSLGYSFSMESSLLSRLRGYNIVDKDKRSRLDLVCTIAERSNNNSSFSIPSYSILMHGVFELYAYATELEENSKLIYQKELPGTQGNGLVDMFCESEDEIILIDAKYKYDYQDDTYFVLSDLDNMVKYIVNSHKRGISIKACFIYPSIKKREESKSFYLSKKHCVLPTKSR